MELKSTLFFEKYMSELFFAKDLDINTVRYFPINSLDKVQFQYDCVCGREMKRSITLFKKKPLCEKCVPKRQKTTIEDFKSY